MTKPINEYTIDELSKKIEAIKAERERTADALKRYEEELERRKNENWLPLNEEINFTINQLTLDASCIEIKAREEFSSQDSFYKYISALKTTRKAWFDNSKSKPIDIKVLLPLLKKGYVAMDKDGSWFWYECKPSKEITFWDSNEGRFEDMFFPINLKPADNWEDSLMECGI